MTFFSKKCHQKKGVFSRNIIPQQALKIYRSTVSNCATDISKNKLTLNKHLFSFAKFFYIYSNKTENEKQPFMEIKRIEEFKLNSNQHLQINQLLQLCFSAYPTDRTFYKQIPSFRYLVFEKKAIVAHLAIIHRMIKIGGKNYIIFGVSDLCVHPDFQHKKIASVLLENLEKLGRKHKIDFITLIAQEVDFYKKNGYEVFNNDCRWLIVNETQSLGIAQRNLDNALMVKPLGDKKWVKETVDFLGNLF